MDITKTDLREGETGLVDLWDGAKEIHGFIHRHIENIGNVHAFIGDLERLAIVAAAIARFAGDVDRRKKVHLNRDQPVSLAFLATATFDIKAETARAVSADFGGGQAREKIADMIENAGVSSGIAPRRPTNR